MWLVLVCRRPGLNQGTVHWAALSVEFSLTIYRSFYFETRDLFITNAQTEKLQVVLLSLQPSGKEGAPACLHTPFIVFWLYSADQNFSKAAASVQWVPAAYQVLPRYSGPPSCGCPGDEGGGEDGAALKRADVQTGSSCSLDVISTPIRVRQGLQTQGKVGGPLVILDGRSVWVAGNWHLLAKITYVDISFLETKDEMQSDCHYLLFFLYLLPWLLWACAHLPAGPVVLQVWSQAWSICFPPGNLLEM